VKNINTFLLLQKAGTGRPKAKASSSPAATAANTANGATCQASLVLCDKKQMRISFLTLELHQ
jgi:hypothetical protein